MSSQPLFRAAWLAVCLCSAVVVAVAQDSQESVRPEKKAALEFQEYSPGNIAARAMEAMNRVVPKASQDRSRPGYHFRPPAQWMNDVCGAFFDKGWYHVFFQFNPWADTWGKGLGWGHARSRDLVQWEFLPPALLPDRENGSVMDASGSVACDDGGRPVLFFAKTPPKGPREQWAAVPEDNDLIRWRRVDIGLKPGQNGVPANIKPSWADMFVFKAGGHTLATFKSSDGLICEALTPNLLSWKAVGKVEGLGGECPNLFPLQDKHVLILSTRPITYRVGEFDAGKIAFAPCFAALRTLDYGPGAEISPENRGLYGTTVFADRNGRMILLGWISGFKTGRGWNGCMSLPRILTLDGDRLIQTPVPELTALRGKHAAIRDVLLAAETRMLEGVRGESCEIVAEFKPAGAASYGVKIGPIRIACGAGRVDVAGTVVPVLLPTTLHVFFDRSVLEVFINDGQQSVTKVICSGTDDLKVEAYAEGGSARVISLDVYEMKSAW